MQIPQRASTIDALRSVEQGMLSLVNHTESEHCAASAAASFHLNTGGQRIRARLALDACARLDLSESDALALAMACELLHNASLVHDDLQDRDTTRRGQPTVWVAYGDEVAICAGDLMLSAAYCALAGITHTRHLAPIMRLVHTRVSQAIRGQCADLQALPRGQAAPDTASPDSAANIFSLADYKTIAINKSGALLSLPLELALLLAGQAHQMQDAQNAAQSFAIAYQIHDDLLDFELDAARHTAMPAINIVSVLCHNSVSDLSSETSQSVAKSHAQTLGLKYLDSAQALCAVLPIGCGDLLVSLARGLQTQLTVGHPGSTL